MILILFFKNMIKAGILFTYFTIFFTSIYILVILCLFETLYKYWYFTIILSNLYYIIFISIIYFRWCKKTFFKSFFHSGLIVIVSLIIINLIAFIAIKKEIVLFDFDLPKIIIEIDKQRNPDNNFTYDEEQMEEFKKGVNFILFEGGLITLINIICSILYFLFNKYKTLEGSPYLIERIKEKIKYLKTLMPMK